MTTPIMIGETEQKPKNWADEILALYRAGNFDVEVAAELQIPMKEFAQQQNDNAAFGRLVDYGRTLCQAFWVGQARKNLTNKTFNPSVWQFVMKNQFGWADRTEQVGSSDMPQGNLDELRKKLEREVASFVKLHSPELESSIRHLKPVN